ncbi:MAG: hypothetical protein HQL32_05065 [Planctomycetes bacterium]|nr:hypothetical protein [Planctomycetota bacterium]
MNILVYHQKCTIEVIDPLGGPDLYEQPEVSFFCEIDTDEALDYKFVVDELALMMGFRIIEVLSDVVQVNYLPNIPIWIDVKKGVRFWNKIEEKKDQ